MRLGDKHYIQPIGIRPNYSIWSLERICQLVCRSLLESGGMNENSISYLEVHTLSVMIMLEFLFCVGLL